MNIIKLVASSSFLTLNKNLIKIFGLDAAAIVGMFASIASYNDNDWFYATYERIEDELGLKKSVASNAIDKIIEVEILIDKREGIPCRRFFKFQEVKLLHFLSCENQTTSSKLEPLQVGDETPTQVVRKSNGIYKNKDKNKSLSLEAMEKYARENNFKIDVKNFHQWCVDEEKLFTGWKNIMKTWASNPRNQIKPKPSFVKIRQKTAEDEKIEKIRSEIKFILGTAKQLDACQYFSEGFSEIDLKTLTIFVKNPKALQYQSILDKINIKIEVK